MRRVSLLVAMPACLLNIYARPWLAESPQSP
jgi:hypothetical protein